MSPAERMGIVIAVIAAYAGLVVLLWRGITWATVRARLDLLLGRLRRRRAGTHLIEEMGRHPERVQPLPDPVEDEIYADIAEQLLDDGLAQVAEETRWTR